MKLPKYIRAIGYQKDQNGIFKRFLIESENWKPHLSKTKNVILNHCHADIKNIAVLGSGWLLDFPIDELLKSDKKISCFDIVHPNEILYKYRNAKVEFINYDFTCGLAGFFYNNLKILRKGYMPDYSKFKLDRLSFNQFDLVVSVNLLTQINGILSDFLSGFSVCQKNYLTEINQILQHHHIDILPENHSLVITETEEIRINHKGEVAETMNLLHTTIDKSKEIETWQWVFDTHFHYYSQWNVIFNIKAYKL